LTSLIRLSLWLRAALFDDLRISFLSPSIASPRCPVHEKKMIRRFDSSCLALSHTDLNFVIFFDAFAAFVIGGVRRSRCTSPWCSAFGDHEARSGMGLYDVRHGLREKFSTCDLISRRSRGTGRRQGTVLLVSLVGGSVVRQIRSISALGPFLCCSACESPQSERRDRPGIACRRECLPHIVETDQALRVVESGSHM
jgi:hypothetical protein